ncbi:MAG: hypothetical protein GKS06_00595 [Acidobacteria bacterium]|nr:hypothetical protein [Acidobacteriota bacterium]
MRSPDRAASLAAAIESALGIKVEQVPTPRKGQFDVTVDGEMLFARGGNPLTRVLLGAGFPELEAVVAEIRERAARS